MRRRGHRRRRVGGPAHHTSVRSGLPGSERQSHNYHVRPADQYDAMIHIDRTRALRPLDPTSIQIEGQRPETCPVASEPSGQGARVGRVTSRRVPGSVRDARRSD